MTGSGLSLLTWFRQPLPVDSEGSWGWHQWLDARIRVEQCKWAEQPLCGQHEHHRHWRQGLLVSWSSVWERGPGIMKMMMMIMRWQRSWAHLKMTEWHIDTSTNVRHERSRQWITSTCVSVSRHAPMQSTTGQEMMPVLYASSSHRCTRGAGGRRSCKKVFQPLRRARRTKVTATVFSSTLVIYLLSDNKSAAFVHKCHTVAMHSDNDTGKSSFSCQTPSKVFYVPNTHCLSLFRITQCSLGCRQKVKKRETLDFINI